MEGKKESVSSFTSDLFGSKDSPGSSSSSGIFGSIFASSPKVVGQESGLLSETNKKPELPGQVWNAKAGASGIIPQNKEVESDKTYSKDSNSFYQEDKGHPCHLSSSIYYGGQDVYNRPQSAQSNGYTSYNKDNGEDDSGSASRGNWWQGSLYY